ncbi:MAG: flagellar hook-associated protein FlgK [Clostridiaceae bacterium]|nr:flagellar hook-associated protein FlgK [Clostridiaceae bacterium]
MRSTFMGFGLALSGISAAQAGLDVTGQNMSNISTEGYSRQELEQSAAVVYGSGKFSTTRGTFTGAGVSVDSIRQIRDRFLDVRYRNAASASGALEKKVDILTNVREIFDETQTDGLNVMYEELYANLQTLSDNAGKVEFSSIVRSSAQKVAKTLNQYSSSLDTIAEQEMNDLSTTVGDINTLLEKINSINDTIKTEMLRGNATNSLSDSRDSYLDKLAGKIGITVESNSDGTVNVKSGGECLLDASTGTPAVLKTEGDLGDVKIIIGDSTELKVSTGSIFGSLEVLNGKGSYAADGESTFRGIPYYKNCLDDFSAALKTTMNELNACNGEEKPLFTGTGASDINISDKWVADANYITASQSGSTDGEGDNILKMISTLNKDIKISDYFTGTFDKFTTTLMLDSGVDVNYESDLASTADLVLTSVANKRESEMGVSLNEETANLLKYQKAFEASSRFMTTLDEALDVIINKMGTVGR